MAMFIVKVTGLCKNILPTSASCLLVVPTGSIMVSLWLCINILGKRILVMSTMAGVSLMVALPSVITLSIISTKSPVKTKAFITKCKKPVLPRLVLSALSITYLLWTYMLMYLSTIMVKKWNLNNTHVKRYSNGSRVNSFNVYLTSIIACVMVL